MLKSLATIALSLAVSAHKHYESEAIFNTLLAESTLKLTAEEKAAHMTRFASRLATHKGELSASLLNETFKATAPVLPEAKINEINAKATTWTAAPSARFNDAQMEDFVRLLGTFVGEDFIEADETAPEIEMNVALPENFNAVEQWPECPTIGHIRDQANCGSCWAFGTTSAFSDRLCIASKGKFTTMLSAQELTSCCGFMKCRSFGCNGGQILPVWKHFVTTGVVTGGEFGDKETCYPYEKAKCAHHIEGSPYPECPKDNDTPACRNSCANSHINFQADHVKAKSAYAIKGVENIKQQIFTNGPVTAAFYVYDDFPGYKSGVYSPTSSNRLGGHAIKIVGWGRENGQDYWLIVNSWNETWGDNGYVKIKMGVCGIDDMVVAGDVEYHSKNVFLA